MSLRLAIMTASLALVAVAGFSVAGVTGVSAEPTCSDSAIVDVEVHGQHVVYDYVSGLESSGSGWPPSGGIIGQTTGPNGGAVIPGGPGAGFHFDLGVAPGASFCNEQANSPGIPHS